MIKCVDVLTTYRAASSGLCEITLRDEKANVWGLFLVKSGVGFSWSNFASEGMMIIFCGSQKRLETKQEYGACFDSLDSPN